MFLIFLSRLSLGNAETVRFDYAAADGGCSVWSVSKLIEQGACTRVRLSVLRALFAGFSVALSGWLAWWGANQNRVSFFGVMPDLLNALFGFCAPNTVNAVSIRTIPITRGRRMGNNRGGVLPKWPNVLAEF